MLEHTMQVMSALEMCLLSHLSDLLLETALCLLRKLQKWTMPNAGAKIEACVVKALIESMSAM